MCWIIIEAVHSYFFEKQGRISEWIHINPFFKQSLKVSKVLIWLIADCGLVVELGNGCKFIFK